jgi:hypothetical protein
MSTTLNLQSIKPSLDKLQALERELTASLIERDPAREAEFERNTDKLNTPIPGLFYSAFVAPGRFGFHRCRRSRESGRFSASCSYNRPRAGSH